MKKMVIIVAMMLLGLTSVFAIAGDAEVEIASTNALTGTGTFSTDGFAQAIVAGTLIEDILVVDELIVNDNSLLGWTLGVVATNGTLNCTATSQTIAYTMQMANVSGTLGTGLDNSTLEAGADITLGANAISPGGTASTPTVDYTFDIVMDVAGAASANKLIGVYVETLTIELSAD